jgi:leucyl aminopeptidase
VAPATVAATRSASAPATRAAASRDALFAPVWIVTSHADFQRFVRGRERSAATRFDGTGRAVVVAELREHQLADLGREMHGDKRCGGYFAFASRDAAEAFVRGDRSRHALQAQAAGPYTIDNADTVEQWLPQPGEAGIYQTIDHLSYGYPNRYYASTHGHAAAAWIRDTWLALAGDRDDVTAELFTDCFNCGGQPSVILTIAGTDLADEVVVLGGHLDSISNSGTGNAMNAPGADDDASGIATLTEVLRVALAGGWKPRRTVQFMGYAAEEVGLRGSNAIASRYAAEGRHVVGVLQLDMTNYRSGMVPDMRLTTDYSNPDLQAFMAALFDTYLAPLGMTRGTETCGYACSDHASWTSAGYPAGMMFEAGDPNGYFPYIHTIYDTLATMGESAAPSVPFAQFGLAFLAELAKTADTGVVPILSTCDGRVASGSQALVAPRSHGFRQTPLRGR